MDIYAFKDKFDLVLKKYVDEKITQSKKLLTDEKLNQFVDYVSDFVFSWGKRIRPYCLRLTYKWYGWDNDDAIMKFGIIFELLHSMALIHDDIIDKSQKRHNVLTMHAYINSILGNSDKVWHISEGQAMLVWDLLLAWVYELRYKNHDFSEEFLMSARDNVHAMIEEVILGQMIDVDMMSSGPAKLDLIEKKNIYKTASYTFVRPMLTWAILAWANEGQKKDIAELAKNLWLAFQLRDDFFDITLGDNTKTMFSDIREWQQTYFTNFIFENWSEDQKSFLTKCMWSGEELSQENMEKLQQIFSESGALEFGKELIKKYVNLSNEFLEKVDFANQDCKIWLKSLIEKIGDRLI